MTAPADKLAKVLALVSSDKDAEALVAARKGAEMVRAEFGDWPELLAAARRGIAIVAERQRAARRNTGSTAMGDHARLAFDLLAHTHALTDWDRGFLTSIVRLSRLSPKQAETLNRIRNRVRGTGVCI